nr:MAG TPA: hypothetical protein [Caudoviricetes sp.]
MKKCIFARNYRWFYFDKGHKRGKNSVKCRKNTKKYFLGKAKIPLNIHLL